MVDVNVDAEHFSLRSKQAPAIENGLLDSRKLGYALTWFRSSAGAERGFCRVCGGNLFWRELDSNAICVSAGTLDPTTGTKLDQHIFVADKGDYYTLDDDLPKLAAR